MINSQNLPTSVGPELQARAIDAARNGIVIVDALGPDMPIIWANQGFLDMSGYPLDEVLGCNCRFLQSNDTDAATVTRIRESLSATTYVQENLLNFRKDGAAFWNELSISPVCADPDSDQVTHFIGIQNDITERVIAQERFESERRVSEALQRSLLMTTPDDSISGFSFDCYYQAFDSTNDKIGGDFFDYFLTGENEVAMIVGDVQGKGLEAATQIAQVKYSLRALLREAPRPARSLFRMNEILNEVGFYGVPKEGRLVSVTIAMVNIVTGQGSFSVAGMDAPLIVRRSGVVEALELLGAPLGSFKEAEYEIVDFTLAPGDSLLMVTDGVTEARSAQGEFLELKGLIEALNFIAPVNSTAQQITEAVRAQTLNFVDGELSDDVCILTGRREG